MFVVDKYAQVRWCHVFFSRALTNASAQCEHNGPHSNVAEPSSRFCSANVLLVDAGVHRGTGVGRLVVSLLYPRAALHEWQSCICAGVVFSLKWRRGNTTSPTQWGLWTQAGVERLPSRLSDQDERRVGFSTHLHAHGFDCACASDM